MKKYSYPSLLIILFFLHSCDKNRLDPNIDKEEVNNNIKDTNDNDSIKNTNDIDIEVYDTIVPFKSISRESFQKWSNLEFRLIKGNIQKHPDWNDKFNAWGAEVFLTDIYGYSSRNFYDHSFHGMFSIPINELNGKYDDEIKGTGKYDKRLSKTYVFNLVKDTYMSSPQIGFGSTRNSCFNGWRWTCDYVYGIDYFDDVLRGVMKSVYFDKNKNCIVLKIKGKKYIDIDFPQLESSQDVSKLNIFRDKDIYINVLYENGEYKSLLNKSNEVQVSEKFN